MRIVGARPGEEEIYEFTLVQVLKSSSEVSNDLDANISSCANHSCQMSTIHKTTLFFIKKKFEGSPAYLTAICWLLYRELEAIGMVIGSLKVFDMMVKAQVEVLHIDPSKLHLPS